MPANSAISAMLIGVIERDITPSEGTGRSNLISLRGMAGLAVQHHFTFRTYIIYHGQKLINHCDHLMRYRMG